MKRVVLLEDYHPSLSFNCDQDEIISLDRAVSYQLGKNNIGYRILEDYYEEKGLRASESEYFFQQLKWFDTFDNFLKENIAYCREYNIPLAKAEYIRIKFFVDIVVIYSYVLSRLFQGDLKGREVVFAHLPFPKNRKYTVFEFYRQKFKNREVFRDLLRLFCEKHNLRFTEQLIDEETDRTPEESIISGRFKDSFIKSQARRIINIIRYKKFSKILPGHISLENLNVLLMHAGSRDIDYPIEQLIRHKARVYLKEKEKVLREDTILRRAVPLPLPGESFRKRIEEECRGCADKLRRDADIITWINGKCSLDVSAIVLPYIKYFISGDCPHILQDAEKMFNFYRQNGIDYVFSRNNTDRDSIGSILAAKYMKGAKSVCIEHSPFALDNEVFGVFEAETYDYTLTRDAISQKYFETSIRDRYKTDCTAIQSPHYTRLIEKKYHKRSSRDTKRPKERIVFVAKEFGNRMRLFNNMTYPLTWYYEFQKRLIDYFGQQPEFDFIYKGSRYSGDSENAALYYISDKKYENISIFTEHFLKSLKFADRVIVDYPAGAFFEAAIAGKPVLCLCADYFRVLKYAKTALGRCLRQFSSIEEAHSIIKEFLHSAPEDYIVKIPVSGDDFIDVFKRMQQD